jgi:hypothetical protein
MIEVTREMAEEAEEMVSSFADAMKGKDRVVLGLGIAKLFGVWLASHHCNSAPETEMYRAELGIWLNSVAYKVTKRIDKIGAQRDSELAAEQG